MSQDQRQTPRFDLDPNTGTLTSAEGFRHLCMVRNVSATGLMIELTLVDQVADLRPGDRISVSSPPEGMEGMLDGSGGEVVWVRGECLGVRLDRPIRVPTA